MDDCAKSLVSPNVKICIRPNYSGSSVYICFERVQIVDESREIGLQWNTDITNLLGRQKLFCVNSIYPCSTLSESEVLFGIIEC